MPTLSLHIGYTKTGTTYLQKEVFTQIPDAHYLDKPGLDLIPQNLPGDGILRRFFAAAPPIWDEHGPDLLNELDIGPHPHTLISDESVTEMTQTPMMVRAHLQKLRDLFEGDLRVILTIRRQDHKLASLYSQLSHHFEQASQEHFETWALNVVETPGGYYGEGHRGIMLDYDAMHTAISDVLPPEHILMIPYELLRSDRTAFLTHLLRFLNVADDAVAAIVDAEATKQAARNVRSIARDTWSIRPIVLGSFWLRPGRLFKALGLPLNVEVPHPSSWRRPSSFTLDADIGERILQRYGRSNARLFERIGYPDIAAAYT